MAATGQGGFFRSQDFPLPKGRDSRLFSNPQALLLQNMQKMHFDGQLTPMISITKKDPDSPTLSPTHKRRSTKPKAQDALEKLYHAVKNVKRQEMKHRQGFAATLRISQDSSISTYSLSKNMNSIQLQNTELDQSESDSVARTEGGKHIKLRRMNTSKIKIEHGESWTVSPRHESETRISSYSRTPQLQNQTLTNFYKQEVPVKMKRLDSERTESFTMKEMRNTAKKQGQMGGGFHFTKGAVRSSSSRTTGAFQKEAGDEQCIQRFKLQQNAGLALSPRNGNKKVGEYSSVTEAAEKAEEMSPPRSANQTRSTNNDSSSMFEEESPEKKKTKNIKIVVPPLKKMLTSKDDTQGESTESSQKRDSEKQHSRDVPPVPKRAESSNSRIPGGTGLFNSPFGPQSFNFRKGKNQTQGLLKCLEIKKESLKVKPSTPSEEEKTKEPSRFSQKRSSSISGAQGIPPLIQLPASKPFHHAPQTPDVYKNMSRRLFYMRREKMIDKSLLIMNFDGILGDIRRSPGCLAQSPTQTIYFRAGMVKGVKQLISKFQIVACITGYRSVQKAKPIRDALVKTGIGFDAIYTMLPKYYDDMHKSFIKKQEEQDAETAALYECNQYGRRKDRYQYKPSYYPPAYIQIYKDFDKLDTLQHSVLILGSLDLDNEEVKRREGLELIAQKQGKYMRPDILCTGVPAKPEGLKGEAPVSLLIPHPRAQPTNLGVPFSNIANLIQNLCLCGIKGPPAKATPKTGGPSIPVDPSLYTSQPQQGTNSRKKSTVGAGQSKSSRGHKEGKRGSSKRKDSMASSPVKRPVMRRPTGLIEQYDTSKSSWLSTYSSVNKNKLFSLKVFATQYLSGITFFLDKVEEKCKVQIRQMKKQGYVKKKQLQASGVNQGVKPYHGLPTFRTLRLSNDNQYEIICGFALSYYKGARQWLQEDGEFHLLPGIINQQEEQQSQEGKQKRTPQLRKSSKLHSTVNRILVMQGHLYQNQPFEEVDLVQCPPPAVLSWSRRIFR